MFKRLLLIFVTLLCGCAHFSDIETFPIKFRERLAQHPVWLTVTSFDNAPGVFPPSETSVIKKWEVVRERGDLIFKETSSSSFLGLMDAIRRNRNTREVVDLRDDVDPEVFFPYPDHALNKRRRFRADKYVFRDIDGKRFEIDINGGGRIVFLPAPNNYFLASNPYDVPDVGIWTTPFGAEGELVAHLRKLIFKDEEEQDLPQELMTGSFLHHDLTIKRQIVVVIDTTFPKPLRSSVQHAVDKWNKALGRKLFTVQEATKSIRPGDCLSGRKLCIRWFGDPHLVFTGANGYTELAFDPQTGLILGGIISIINDDVHPPFASLSAADKAKFQILDRDWVTDVMHRYQEMNGILHPDANHYAEYLILHEMGHFNGLGHNFYTNEKTTPERPISSVMSYPPFPVAHRANYIGAADKKRLAIVYGDKPPAKDLSYCSTFEAMAPERLDAGFYKKPASCDMFTIGDAADWYIRLAKRGRFGVFTAFPDISNLSDDMQTLYRELSEQRRLPPLNVLTRLGFILSDDAKVNARRRQMITTYLCSFVPERLAIETQLSTFHGYTLKCPKS